MRSSSKSRLAAGAAFVSVASLGLVLQLDGVNLAQAQQGDAAQAGELSEAASRALMDPKDTVILLLDHQSGLFQTVKDIPVEELRRNTIALARAGELAKVPVFLTVSEPNGPNGPLIDGLKEAAPS